MLILLSVFSHFSYPVCGPQPRALLETESFKNKVKKTARGCMLYYRKKRLSYVLKQLGTAAFSKRLLKQEENVLLVGTIFSSG